MDNIDSNKSFESNPRRYEGHLTLFGRKVLDTLINKWTADRNRVQKQNAYSSYKPRVPPIHPTTQWTQSKKAITFLSEQPRAPQPPPIICTPISNENVSMDKTFDFEANDNNLPVVPTSNELFKSIQQKKNGRIEEVIITASNSRTGEENVSTCDINNQVIDGNKDRQMFYDSYNRLDDDGSTNPVVAARDDTEFSSVTGSRVNWDDMFDTELLPDIVTNPKLMIQQNVNTTSTQKIFNADDNKYDDIKMKEITETKTNGANPSNAKKAKRKTQPKVTDVIPKKIKKINETDKPKTIFRKQTYTKIIKNWLDDVDPNNPVEEETLCKDENTDEAGLEEPTSNSNTEKKKSSNITECIIIEKVKEKLNKKVVQAQLANKDGKMKFGKPKKTIETETESGKTENVDKTMGKKSKSKFVAPIKSQVPVIDLKYEVVTVDDTNIGEHTERIRGLDNKDLNMVLVYSNGFSQLNRQHTEDSCDPEGVMLHVEQRFYYFRGVHRCFKEVIVSVLENNNVICFGGKSLLIYFKSKLGLELEKLSIIDAKIGGSLLDPDNPPDNFSDLQKLLSYTAQYTIATECALQKTAWYASLLDECGVRLTSLLKESGLWSVFVHIEMKLVPIIAEMEGRGVPVDLDKLRGMEEVLVARMRRVERACHAAAGRAFQLTSVSQVRAILYDELQLDTRSNVTIRETVSLGAKSTSETMLRRLVSVHPLPKLILEYRHLHKAHATFLTGIALQVRNGVVRPTWVQTAAVTGRIASNNPNLQAIPKAPFSLILFPDENESEGNQTLSIRSVYTSRSGYTLVGADFQHVECRVFAHCAGDAALLTSLREGGDLFRALAAKWLNKPASDISSAERDRTKRIVYASMYGAGCHKLMDILGATYEQTLSIIASFNRTFPSLKSFGRSVVARCEQNGGRLSTVCGRGRHFKNIGSQDFQLRSQAERQAVNFVVQGSAADLCKMAMVRTCERLRAHRPPVDGGLLLQIHDELVWEIRDEHVHTAAAIIKEVMEGCGQHCGLATSLPVAVCSGRTWGDMAAHPAA